MFLDNQVVTATAEHEVVLEHAGIRSHVQLKTCQDRQTTFYWLGERRRRKGGRPKGAKSSGAGEPRSSAACTCRRVALLRIVSPLRFHSRVLCA